MSDSAREYLAAAIARLSFDGEAFVFGDQTNGYDQVAFVTDEKKKTVCISMSEEDMENGEINERAREEIRMLRPAIILYIKQQGFTIENEDDDDDQDEQSSDS